MKLALTLVLVLGSSMALAQEMKHFNKVLIQEVQHDLATDNDQKLKKNNAPMRGPASVEVEAETENYQENVKIKKNERQLGNSKW